jgi:hypothetical protein
LLALLDNYIWPESVPLPDILDSGESEKGWWREVRKNYIRLRRGDIDPMKVGEETFNALKHTVVKPGASEESKNKIRVFSLHPSDETHLARTLTKRWLKRLKRVGICRDKLRGQIVRLERKVSNLDLEQPELTSADLRAATDHVVHELAQHVWSELNTAVEDPGADWESGMHILGPHRLECPGHSRHKRLTRRGIHMGLGLSWPILCVINGWAAWAAGIPDKATAVCGDDAILLCSSHEDQLYQKNLEEAELVVNKDKSYRGRNGVFCEDLVKISGCYTDTEDNCEVYTADSVQLLRIAEATGYKSIQGMSTDRLSVARALRRETQKQTSTKHASPALNLSWSRQTPLLGIARANLRHLEEHLLSGPEHLGGSGSRLPTTLELVSLAALGPLRCYVTDVRNKHRSASLTEARLRNCPKGGTDFQSAQVEWKIEDERILKESLKWHKRDASGYQRAELRGALSPKTLTKRINDRLKFTRLNNKPTKLSECVNPASGECDLAWTLSDVISAAERCQIRGRQGHSSRTLSKLRWIQKTRPTSQGIGGALDRRTTAQVQKLLLKGVTEYVAPVDLPGSDTFWGQLGTTMHVKRGPQKQQS